MIEETMMNALRFNVGLGMRENEIAALKEVAMGAAIIPYCGDKDGLRKIMECRMRKFHETFTPNVVLELIKNVADNASFTPKLFANLDKSDKNDI